MIMQFLFNLRLFHIVLILWNIRQAFIAELVCVIMCLMFNNLREADVAKLNISCTNMPFSNNNLKIISKYPQDLLLV